MPNVKDEIIVFLSNEILDMKKQIHNLTLLVIALKFELGATTQKINFSDNNIKE